MMESVITGNEAEIRASKLNMGASFRFGAFRVSCLVSGDIVRTVFILDS